MNATPLNDRVIIKRREEDEKTEGGIIIPESAKELPLEGEVIAVGPGKTEFGHFCPTTVSIRAKVLFSKYSGTEIEIEGNDYLIMREEDILIIL